MKKILALVLTAATAISVASIGTAGASLNASNPNEDPAWGIISPDAFVSDDDYVNALGSKTPVYLNKNNTYVTYLTLQNVVVVDSNVTLTGPTFKGPNSGETNSISVKYENASGSHSGIPKGVNGEDLLRIRVSFDADATIGTYSRASYVVSMTAIKNPTVEVFSNTQVTLKIATTIGRIASKEDLTNNAAVKAAQKQAITFSVNPFGIAQEGYQGNFTVANERYTRKDVISDANGKLYIDAGTEKPVVDETAFDKAYGKDLTVRYPNYNVTFKNVKNQNVAINLEATVKKAGTVALDSKTPIMIATFHDIYVKDNVEIEFKISADAQNFKGQELYIYALNADGKPTQEVKMKIRITDNNTIVMEVPAGSRLGAEGDIKSSTYGIYAEPQTLSEGGTSTGGGKNPGTGASDVVNAATAFAAVSLAAAGFVAVKKFNR